MAEQHRYPKRVTAGTNTGNTQNISAGVCEKRGTREKLRLGESLGNWASELGGRLVFTVEPSVLLELVFNHMPALVFILMFLIVGKRY